MTSRYVCVRVKQERGADRGAGEVAAGRASMCVSGKNVFLRGSRSGPLEREGALGQGGRGQPRLGRGPLSLNGPGGRLAVCPAPPSGGPCGGGI